MLHIKQAQSKIAELIKADIKDPVMIYALNSGKRLRSAIFADLSRDSSLALAVEYIHTGILLLSDMKNNVQVRRGMPPVHVKYGNVTASLVANRFLIRGCGLIQYMNVSAAVHEHIQSAIEDLMTEDADLCPREAQEKQFARAGRVFSIAFLIYAGTQEAIEIGHSFGICYFLAMSQTQTQNMEKFTDCMKEAVTGFSRLKLWNPTIKEITSYIIAKFDKI
jgi:hypothetical protein